MNRQTVCCIYNWSPPNAANSLSAAKLAHCHAENSLMNRQTLQTAHMLAIGIPV